MSIGRFKTTIILLCSHGFFGKLFFSKNNYESWVIWLKRFKKKGPKSPNYRGLLSQKYKFGTKRTK